MRSGISIISLMLAVEAHAAVYYVAPDGNDSNAGTSEAAPWASVIKAASTMVAGDTTYVKNGRYSGAVRFSRSGTAAAPIRLLNYPGHRPAIQTTAVTAGNNPITFTLATGGGLSPIEWITVEGFEITNTAVGQPNSTVLGIRFNGAANITLRRLWIHDVAQGMNGTVYNVTIADSLFSHVGNFVDCAANPAGCNQAHSIYLTGRNVKVLNNVIYDTTCTAIQLAGYPFDQKTFSMPDANYSGAEGWLVANNTLAFQQNCPAIFVWQAGARNNRFENNIFYENDVKGGASPSTGQGIWFIGGAGNTLKNNLFYATAPGGTGAVFDRQDTGGPSYTETGRVWADPQFVNELAGDFHLQAASPAINAGAAVAEVLSDFDGRARIAPFDIGAFEFNAGTPAANSSPARPKNVVLR